MNDQDQPAPPNDGAGDASRVDPFETMLNHRTFRWRVSMALLIVFLGGGCVLIIAGVSSDAVAGRIDKMSGIVGSFMFSVVGLLSALFGFGTIDNRTAMYGGGYSGRSYSSSRYSSSSRAD